MPVADHRCTLEDSSRACEVLHSIGILITMPNVITCRDLAHCRATDALIDINTSIDNL